MPVAVNHAPAGRYCRKGSWVGSVGMDLIEHLDIPLLLASITALLLLVVGRLAHRWSLPAPAIFLGLGMLVNGWNHAANVSIDISVVAKIGSVVLVLILFEGGFTGGFRRARASIGPIMALGVLGTFITTAIVAAAAHYLCGLPWEAAAIVAIALAPTDPAAVFSVLGSRDVEGRSSAIIEGESGVNDPVSIALMVGALAYLSGGGSALHIGIELVVDLSVGLGLGVVFGRAGSLLLGTVRPISETLIPFAALAVAFLTYSATNMLHGSGYLAVFIAGLVMGDRLRRFGSIVSLVSLSAALAEIAMFTMLGLTVAIDQLGNALGVGVAVFALLTFLIRPVITWLLLLPSTLTRSEVAFIAWGGLRGAVPILLASFAILEHVEAADHIYSIVFVAVAASICLQGGTIPSLIDRLGLVSEPERSD